MSEYLLDENHANSVRLKISSTARAMLANEMDFLLGARTLSSLMHSVPDGSDDSDFMAFHAIDSETDHFPLGEACQYWDKEALARLHPEIKAAEAWARKFGESACASLVTRFSD